MTASFASGPPGLLRALNARAVLETVATHGPITRMDVASSTALSKPTVAACLALLVERGAVDSGGAVSGRKGPAATLYQLSPGAAWAIGVDVGHDRVRAALVDATGERRAHADLPVRRTRAALCRQVRELCLRLTTEVGIDLSAVGHVVVGVPGAVGPDGELSFADALPKDGAGLVTALRAALPVPVSFDNDVNLAAIAEHAALKAAALEASAERGTQAAGTDARARDVDDFVLVSVGAGIGAGLVIGGRLHRGVSGAAGEVGFLPAAGLGAERPHMVEHEVGGDVVSALAVAAGITGDTTAKAVFNRARAGDQIARDVVDRTARSIAYVVACLSAVTDPSCVVLGGSVGSNGDLLLEPVRRHVRELTTLRTPIEASSLGSDAVLAGALAMALTQARETAFSTFAGNSAGAPADQQSFAKES